MKTDISTRDLERAVNLLRLGGWNLILPTEASTGEIKEDTQMIGWKNIGAILDGGIPKIHILILHRKEVLKIEIGGGMEIENNHGEKNEDTGKMVNGSH